MRRLDIYVTNVAELPAIVLNRVERFDISDIGVTFFDLLSLMWNEGQIQNTYKVDEHVQGYQSLPLAMFVCKIQLTSVEHYAGCTWIDDHGVPFALVGDDWSARMIEASPPEQRRQPNTNEYGTREM